MKERFETENVLLGTFVAMLVGITATMGWLTYREPPRDPNKTITILIPADTAYVDSQKKLDAAYKKLRPEIHVQPIKFTWDNIWQKLEFMIVAGIPPDVSGIEQPNLPKFTSAGEVEPLDDWIKNDPSFDPGKIIKECMDEGNWDGVQWAIPTNFSPVCLWYNKTLFDQAGVPYPTRDWTQEDVLAAAQKLTKDLNGDGIPDIWGFFTNNNHWNRYPCWIWQRGGAFTDPEITRATLDDPITVGGIRWLTDLALKYRVMPSTLVMGTFNSSNLFISGRLAMNTETRYFMPAFFQEKNRDKVKSFAWDVCELPRDKYRATTFVVGMYIIPKTVPEARKRMAWDYIKFLVSDAGQEVVRDNNTALPAVRSWAEKTVTHPGVPPSNDRAFLDSVAYARYMYWPFPAEQAFMEARSDLQGVWNGDLDALEVCQKATLDINKMVADYLRENPGKHLPVKTRWVPFSERAVSQALPPAPESPAAPSDPVAATATAAPPAASVK